MLSFHMDIQIFFVRILLVTDMTVKVFGMGVKQYMSLETRQDTESLFTFFTLIFLGSFMALQMQAESSTSRQAFPSIVAYKFIISPFLFSTFRTLPTLSSILANDQ